MKWRLETEPGVSRAKPWMGRKGKPSRQREPLCKSLPGTVECLPGMENAGSQHFWNRVQEGTEGERRHGSRRELRPQQNLPLRLLAKISGSHRPPKCPAASGLCANPQPCRLIRNGMMETGKGGGYDTPTWGCVPSSRVSMLICYFTNIVLMSLLPQCLTSLAGKAAPTA